MTTNYVCRVVEKEPCSHSAGGNVNWNNPSGEKCGKYQHNPAFRARNPLAGIYPEDMPIVQNKYKQVTRCSTVCNCKILGLA